MDDKSHLTTKQQIITTQVNGYFSSYTKPQNFHYFTFANLTQALKEIDNSKVKGYDVISYGVIKKSLSSTTQNCLLFSSKMTDKLNVTIIKPILMDPNKNT